MMSINLGGQSQGAQEPPVAPEVDEIVATETAGAWTVHKIAKANDEFAVNTLYIDPMGEIPPFMYYDADRDAGWYLPDPWAQQQYEAEVKFIKIEAKKHDRGRQNFIRQYYSILEQQASTAQEKEIINKSYAIVFANMMLKLRTETSVFERHRHHAGTILKDAELERWVNETWYDNYDIEMLTAAYHNLLHTRGIPPMTEAEIKKYYEVRGGRPS